MQVSLGFAYVSVDLAGRKTPENVYEFEELVMTHEFDENFIYVWGVQVEGLWSVTGDLLFITCGHFDILHVYFYLVVANSYFT